MPPLYEALTNGALIPYTQWEAWLALYHGKALLIAKAKTAAPRGPNFAPSDASRAAQAAHLTRLKALHRYPGSEFGSPDELAKQIAYSAVLDLLVVDELARQGVVQHAADVGIETSVIASLAARLKPTQKLDFAQAVAEVSYAVDVAIKVAKEGSKGSSDQMVDEVLKRIAVKTKANDPNGATREAEEGIGRWEKQEAGRRASAIASGLVLLEAALNTDLLRFDAAAVAARVERITSLQHEGDPDAVYDAVHARWDQFYTEGRNKGLNFSLEVAIAIARRVMTFAQGPDQPCAAQNDLGVALATIGERESGTARLEEAVNAYRAALEERTRERVPLDWAMTQNNLGAALETLGERESRTEKLEQAARPIRAALEERTRERVPLEWAGTQRISALRFRELASERAGTEKLEEAVAAFRAALEERTRERVPL